MDIEKVLSELTLEEKASLLSGDGYWHTKAVERLGLPRIMMSDGPHGLRKQNQQADNADVNESIKAVCFPAACAAAASFDREVAEITGEALADACLHEEVGLILGPAVNIKRSPLCGRNFEYYSEDPYLAGELAAAFIHGVQSRGVGTSIKHFAANSQEHRRMSSDSVVDERTLREIYLPAFEKAVKEEQPWTVMCSYNRLNGEYASQNHWLLTKVLREEWGFEGLVVSDWGAVSDRVKGVAAGLDLEMPSSGGVNDRLIVEAVRNKVLAEEAVDACVRRVLKLVDRAVSSGRPDTCWDMEAQHRQAGKLAAECMVLLKNEDHVLPFSKKGSVAVIGEFAAKPRFQGGGSSHINCFRVESLLDALAGMPGITYAKGYSIDDETPDEALILEAVEAAGKAEKVVIAAGLPDSFESEGYDRTHMRMPACQTQLIQRVAAANPDTVVVLYNGSPVEMPWADDVKGILEGYLAGQAVGFATRALLWGEENPCGRLPESFPMRLEDNPSWLSYGGEGNTAVYREGIFAGYRYYETKKMAVRYPFGYGLSYTSFEYANLRTDAGSIGKGRKMSVSVDVSNTGEREGKEIVQLYIAAPAGKWKRPVRELKGFEKILLQPGETRTVSFELDERAFACWDTDMHDWYAENGTYRIQIGKNSRDIVLETEVTVEGNRPGALPELDLDTIYMDLVNYPGALEAFHGMMARVMNVSDGQTEDAVPDREDGGAGEKREAKKEKTAAKEAISEEMDRAMLNYLPLRGMISFSDGEISREQILGIVEELRKKM